MRQFFSDVKNTLYSPSFYRHIRSRSNTEIFKYIGKLAVFLGVVYTITFVITLITMGSSPLGGISVGIAISATVMAIIASFLAYTIGGFIVFVIGSYIYGLLVMLLTLIVKPKLNYDGAHKCAVYALTPVFVLSYILIPFSTPDFLGYVLLILPLVIFAFNHRKNA